MASKEAGNRLIEALLERLYTSMSRGPALNAHPGNSRQRVDLANLERIGASPSAVLTELLGETRTHRTRYNVAPPARNRTQDETEETKTAKRVYEGGQKLLCKLSTLAREAETYHRDTGAAALFIGYPLLSLPEAAARKGFGSSRLLAPLAFIPITLEVATGMAVCSNTRTMARKSSRR